MIVAFVSGLLFALGIVLSGMGQPHKIVGFLDFFSGAWDPSLALVMVGAIGVHVAALQLQKRLARPWLAPAFPPPPAGRIDKRLVGGAALFGIGWGLGGFCPGPAVVSIAAAMRAGLVFLPAMLAGMVLHRLVTRKTA